jgi:two-component system chemotaxis response regulator CheB
MIPQASAAPGRSAAGDTPIRVLIVDDSVVIRAMIARILSDATRFKIVGAVANGKLALEHLARDPVDVVVLDIEMPVMSGLEALPRMIEAVPGIKIIMASTLTLRGAAVSLEALQKGAADFVPKPTSSSEMGSTQNFARELAEKVFALGSARVKARARSTPAGAIKSSAAPAAEVDTGTERAATSLYGRTPIVLRQASRERPRVLAIGSSTGGPQALFTLFGALGSSLKVPVLLTQHMPAHFTAILAEHITRLNGLPAREAEDGEPLVGGRIFIAPGDFHMVVENKGVGVVLRLLKTPPENFCRPAVDPMLRSVAQCFGAKGLALILTGMGQDGLVGGRELVRAGGTVIAQDEPTSVVWGMPGAVATNGVCSAVLPLDRIAAHLKSAIGDGAP